MRIPCISGHGWHAQIADWMYITWRMRTNMLKDNMEFIQCRDDPPRHASRNRSYSGPATERRRSEHTFQAELEPLRKDGGRQVRPLQSFHLDALKDAHATAEFLFCTPMNKYMALFTDEAFTLEQRLRRAGFVLHCLASWKTTNTTKFPEKRLEDTASPTRRFSTSHGPSRSSCS